MAHRDGASDSVAAKEKVATKTPQTERLSKVLKTNVSLRRTAKGGKLEIAFSSEDDLERILTFIAKK